MEKDAILKHKDGRRYVDVLVKNTEGAHKYEKRTKQKELYGNPGDIGRTKIGYAIEHKNAELKLHLEDERKPVEGFEEVRGIFFHCHILDELKRRE